jgi:hypothetical protein
MTGPQAVRIAEAAIAKRDAERELTVIEARSGGAQPARDQRKVLAAAELELNRAIDNAVEP